MWHHRKLTGAGLLLVVSLLLNVIAFLHARAMTHYVPGGTRPARPESLTVLEKAGVLLAGVTVPRPENAATPASVGLAFTAHRFAGDGGSDLEAWHVAHPEPKGLVLLFPGYAAAKDSLLGEARAFHDLGFASFLVDFRGCGGSGGCETTIGVEEARDVARAVDYAGRRWPGQPLVLFGHSMGAVAVLRAVAVEEVRPAAVVVECPYDRLLTTVANRFSAMGLPSFPFAQLLVFWGGVQQGFNGFRHNPVDYAPAVGCPVLQLHGAEDPRVSVAQAEAVFQRLGGEKRFELFTGVGHESYVAAKPHQWKRSVSEFLARYVSQVPGN
jgi:alpha-beta hydrolase superfamily lysophospholipase